MITLLITSVIKTPIATIQLEVTNAYVKMDTTVKPKSTTKMAIDAIKVTVRVSQIFKPEFGFDL